MDCSAIIGAGEPCAAEETCVTKYVWQRISQSINQTVDEIFLSDLFKEGCCHSQAERPCKG